MAQHIEFFGLPGAGKTKLTTLISKNHLSNTYMLPAGFKKAIFNKYFPECASIFSDIIPVEIFDKTIAIRSSPRLNQIDDNFGCYVNHLLHRYSPDQKRRDTVKRWIKTLMQRYKVAMEFLQPHNTILCDEGFLMRANALFCPPNPLVEFEPPEVKKYLSLMPQPDQAILLDIPVSKSIERLQNRPTGPPISFNNQSDRDQIRRLKTMETFIEYAWTGLYELDIPHYRVNNEGCIESTLDEILEIVNQ